MASPPSDCHCCCRCRRGRCRWGHHGPGQQDGHDGWGGIIHCWHHHPPANATKNHCAPVQAIGDNGVPPPPIIVVFATVGGGVVNGGVMDQAVTKDAMDAEAAALFVIGIIIIAPTPPKIIAPSFKQSIPLLSSEPSSSPHCLLTDGGQIRVGGL